MPLPLSPPSAAPAIRFTTMAQAPASLMTVGADIVGVIVDWLVILDDAELETDDAEETERPASVIELKPLSLAHSFLQRICWDRMFRDFTWRDPWDEIPDAIAPHILKFMLSMTETDNYNASRLVVAERLAAILKKATKLNHFWVEVAGNFSDRYVEPGPELTAAISQASRLQTLQFTAFRWWLPLPISPSWALPQTLTRFIYDRRGPLKSKDPESSWKYLSGLPRDAKRDFREAKSLFYLVTANAKTLEELVLPAEISLLGAFCSVSWPRLRELTFFGFPPEFACPPLYHLLINQTGSPALPLLQRLVIRIGRLLPWKDQPLLIFPSHDNLPRHDSRLFPVFGSTGPNPDIQFSSVECISAEAETDASNPVASATLLPSPTKDETGGMAAVEERREDNGESSGPTERFATAESSDFPAIDRPVSANRDIDEKGEMLSISSGLTKTDNSAVMPPTTRLADPTTTDSPALEITDVDEKKVEAALLEPAIAAAIVPPPVLPSLQSLLVANPHVDDLFWQKVPASIKELALLGYPHYSRPINISDMVEVPYMKSLPAIELRLILSSISAISLTILRLSFWESEDDFPFFDLVAQRYPSLRVLEIHRYGFEHNLSTADLERICQSLVVLEHLEVLKLDLKFRGSVEPSRRATRLQWNTWSATTQEASKLILDALPQLKLSALALFNSKNQFYWYEAWSVIEQDGSRGYRQPKTVFPFEVPVENL
ncbi:hypothetical protein C8J56DRAFT_63962 [Mycena floridula]|nr:hypothetical protein C8J56DRAFT_63962 [Mycena floridula]